MKRGPDGGYFPEPDKPLFISDTPGQEEAARREFVAEGIILNFISVSIYLGYYLGLQKKLEEWVIIPRWRHGPMGLEF